MCAESFLLLYVGSCSVSSWLHPSWAGINAAVHILDNKPWAHYYSIILRPQGMRILISAYCWGGTSLWGEEVARFRCCRASREIFPVATAVS